MALPTLPWIDWLLLAVLAASVVLGFVRGLVYEALALAGWVVAWFAAQWAAPPLAPHLPLGEPGSALQIGAAFALAFFLALVVWGLLARLVRMLVRATPLSLLDRMLGSGFGVFRGLVLLLAVATVVMLTPAAQSDPWRGSHGAQLLGQALDSLKPLLPEAAAQLLPA
ncbi:MAG: CvpA family protein [Rubrivivax sp.]|nr:CvpA family protein [Rubrivivax sp.]